MLSVTHGSRIGGESVSWSAETTTRGYFFGWLTSFVLFFGLLTIWSRQPSFLPVFFAAGYIALLCVLVRTIRVWRDLFNPLCLMLFIGFVRFSCPGFLQWSGAEPPEEVDLFFRVMKLTDGDWQWGHALALIGLLAAAVGWVFAQGHCIKRQALKFHLSDGIKYSTLAGMLVGAMALVAFVLSNASLGTIASGEFRETTIQEGTGPFFRLSYLLMAGSVLLSCYLLTKGNTRGSLIPVVISMLLYWVLGGRWRAAAALAGGLILLWYLSREANRWGRLAVKRTHLLLAPIGLFFAAWLSYVGSLYRGGLGAQAFSESLSLSGLWEYIQSSVYTDMGQLHSLAAAIAIGPGVLGGQTFIGSLTWPLNKFFPIPGRSAGVFIVETLVGFPDGRPWGVNASLIGDAYLNFGLGGVVIVMLLFGVLLKVLYLKFRQGSVHGAIYSLALLSSLQAFWLSIDVWPQALTTLTFAFFLIFLGKTIFQVRSV